MVQQTRSKLSQAEISTHRWKTHGLREYQAHGKEASARITWHKEIRKNTHKDLLRKIAGGSEDYRFLVFRKQQRLKGYPSHRRGFKRLFPSPTAAQLPADILGVHFTWLLEYKGLNENVLP